MRQFAIAGLAVALVCAAEVGGATYYVDYEAGDDARAGTSQRTAWKHAPGDDAATGKPQAVELQPGDVVKFKGGVVYLGMIEIRASGSTGTALTFDGNTAGDWGEGQAIIDGSVPLGDLTRCASAEEAYGNPHFENIYWTTVPAGAKWQTLNIRQGLAPLAWSMDPNPGDPVFQERPGEFHPTDEHIPRNESKVAVEALGNIGENRDRPLMAMFDGSRLSAIVHQMANGAEVKITLTKPVTVSEFGVTPQANYVHPKEMSFMADGREVLRTTLEHHPKESREQRFKLDKPATFTALVIKFHSAYQRPGKESLHFGAVRQIAGYNAAGENVLLADDRKAAFRNDHVFVQDDPHFYDNAIMAFYGSRNFIYYKRLRGFDPEKNTIYTEPLKPNERPYESGGAFAIVNNPRFIDTPGEYAMILDPDEHGRHKLLVWPPNGTPADVTCGRCEMGFEVTGGHVIVDGFWVRKQGGTNSWGIRAEGRGDEVTDVVIRNCKVSHLRGSDVGIFSYGVNYLLVDNCEVSENAGHTKGMVLRNAHHVVARRCVLHKNSSTALDYYTVDQGVVQDCLVTENQGMHANGLTFYVGCRNILVERNIVRDGNVGMTLHTGENMIVRNNIIEGRADTQAVGLWAGAPYNNIVMTNNIFRHYGVDPHDPTVGIFGDNRDAQNYAIVNNVIDGISGNILFKAEFHHNILTRFGPGLTANRLGNNTLVEDMEQLYVDAHAYDYRPAPHSPSIDAGTPLGGINACDINGVPRPQGEAFDIGPYERPVSRDAADTDFRLIDPREFAFSFQGYEIKAPEKFEATYELKYQKREGVKTIVLKGVDLTGEGGGKVNRRVTRGGYISAWSTPGHWLEWTIDAPQAGPYEVAIEHGSQMNAERMVTLNGEVVGGMEAVRFPATGEWTVFDKSGLPKPLILKQGENKVRFEYVSGHLNFRTLEFVPVVVE